MHLTGGSEMVVGFLSDFCHIWRSIVNDVLGAPSKAAGGWSTFERIITNVRVFFTSFVCIFAW